MSIEELFMNFPQLIQFYYNWDVSKQNRRYYSNSLLKPNINHRLYCFIAKEKIPIPIE